MAICIAELKIQARKEVQNYVYQRQSPLLFEDFTFIPKRCPLIWCDYVHIRIQRAKERKGIERGGGEKGEREHKNLKQATVEESFEK